MKKKINRTYVVLCVVLCAACILNVVATDCWKYEQDDSPCHIAGTKTCYAACPPFWQPCSTGNGNTGIHCVRITGSGLAYCENTTIENGCWWNEQHGACEVKFYDDDKPWLGTYTVMYLYWGDKTANGSINSVVAGGSCKQ